MVRMVCDKCEEFIEFDEIYKIDFISTVSWWTGSERKYLCKNCKKQFEELSNKFLEGD